MHNPVNTVISFGLMIAIVSGSFYYVYAFTPRGPWLGIEEGIFLTPGRSEALQLDQDQGFLVFTIASESPADRSGLQGGNEDTVNIGGRLIPIDGDIIVSLDGRQINQIEDICNVLGQKQVGDNVRIAVIREGSSQEFNVMLEEAPPGRTSEC